MTTRLEIVRELRGWIGTPWVHQGRSKGIGCDCLGIVEAAARAAGYSPSGVPRHYHRRPFNNLLESTLDRFLDAIDADSIKIADVVMMTWKGHSVPAHTGILTPWQHEDEIAPFGLIHALVQTGAVSEHHFVPELMNVVGYYRIPGLA